MVDCGHRRNGGVSGTDSRISINWEIRIIFIQMSYVYEKKGVVGGVL